MRGHRVALPDGARFAGSLVADGEHEIHGRGARGGKFIPALAAQMVCGHGEPFGDGAGGEAIGAAFDEHAEDGEAGFVCERAEGGHGSVAIHWRGP